jgi:RimJ/RimL family protein N-acetyltransferase
MDEITTARLHLRRFTVDDLDAHYVMVGSDPQVTWTSQVQSRQQAQAALEGRIRHWEEHGFGMWAIIERATQQLIGHGGLQMLEQSSEVELGYYLGRVAWGRGLATELGRAVVQYGFTQLHLPKIVAVVRPENHSSQRVLSKLGFEYLRNAHYYGFDVQYWCLQNEQPGLLGQPATGAPAAQTDAGSR